MVTEGRCRSAENKHLKQLRRLRLVNSAFNRGMSRWVFFQQEVKLTWLDLERLHELACSSVGIWIRWLSLYRMPPPSNKPAKLLAELPVLPFVTDLDIHADANSPGETYWMGFLDPKILPKLRSLWLSDFDSYIRIGERVASLESVGQLSDPLQMILPQLEALDLRNKYQDAFPEQSNYLPLQDLRAKGDCVERLKPYLTGIRSLDLHNSCTIEQRPSPLDDYIPGPLTQLELSSYHMTASELSTLIKRHAKTLEDLWLTCIALKEDEHSGMFCKILTKIIDDCPNIESIALHDLWYWQWVDSPLSHPPTKESEIISKLQERCQKHNILLEWDRSGEEEG